jgi:peptidoglycan/xylan/chitin deacetylase (PgdA/CDA1 family)
LKLTVRRRLGIVVFFSPALFLIPAITASAPPVPGFNQRLTYDHGAIVRGDTTRKEIALVFTGHEFSDGGEPIALTLKKQKVRASFFFTGDFYRASGNARLIEGLKRDGHYLGPHSDKHLLYCSWEKREELLVKKEEFVTDILHNYESMSAFGVEKDGVSYFIPPYEWYNDTIAAWTKDLGLVLFNFTPGTASNADYTTPDLPNYKSSEEILRSIFEHDKSDPHGLNGFILLLHIGTHPDRKDKFYLRLDELIAALKSVGYSFVRIDRLLGRDKEP